MRRSKRLAAKKEAAFSETEGSSQEEPADITIPEIGDLVSKPYGGITTDGKEAIDDEDASSERNTCIWTSSQEEDEPGKAEEFLSLPSEFKSKLKE